ncbi:hypothetical protein NADFUDRAFT_82418 [Nadsonia fulvescens var. elongata DSM 6958]|uniref:Uncharacterized protein n=1 Tax=Nadsonia fulvescens var. elongata DSM 6958 TaxID=857566 RepID=A0A1E3PMK1_9ASCO|nr:hypothetical protein NADFUDRAFT_82418 [Nadsonia fulvescens var. elongata DSM 6958]
MKLLNYSRHFLSGLLATLLLLGLLVTPGCAYTSYCKCQCSDKYEIITLDLPRDAVTTNQTADSPSPLTCYNCTRSYCFDLNLDICREKASTNGHGNESSEVEIKLTLDDYTATCFNRESLKEKFIVYMFCLTTVGLVAYASLKSVMGPLLERFHINRNTRL